MLEVLEPQTKIKPVVVTGVTLGKELHAGHMLLLATADLLRVGLGERDPVVLVNNNTGPRAAGTLISLSQEAGLPVGDTARLLDKGFIRPEVLIDAYRGRIEEEELVDQASSLLDEGEFDIFRAMTDRIEDRLKRLNFAVTITPESGKLLGNQCMVEAVNPLWSSTGFMFNGNKGVRVLQQGGKLTATGKCFVSLASLAKEKVEEGKEPLVVFVDSSPDTIDAVASYPGLDGLGKAMQLQGAGISFRGSIASGSKGEAFTLTQVIEEFHSKLPRGSLKLALRQLVLRRPALVTCAKSPTLGALFDFRDNESFIDDLVRAHGEAQEFDKEITSLINKFSNLVGDQTQAADPKLEKWLAFLPLKTQAILEVSAEKVVQTMRNIGKVLKNPQEITAAVSNQGYKEQEARDLVDRYREGPAGLVTRDNFYLGVLQSIASVQDKIASLSLDDFEHLQNTINFCRERLGYESD